MDGSTQKKLEGSPQIAGQTAGHPEAPLEELKIIMQSIAANTEKLISLNVNLWELRIREQGQKILALLACVGLMTLFVCLGILYLLRMCVDYLILRHSFAPWEAEGIVAVVLLGSSVGILLWIKIFVRHQSGKKHG